MEAEHPEIINERLRSAGEPPLPGGVTVYGFIAKNGHGQRCFFATSRSDGFPIVETGAIGAMAEAAGRRITHDELERLDP